MRERLQILVEPSLTHFMDVKEMKLSYTSQYPIF